MAGLVLTLLVLIVQFIGLDCTKWTVKWVYKPYGIQMCRVLCQNSTDIVYFIQEDLSCHRVSSNYSTDSTKVSPKQCYMEARQYDHISGRRFLNALPVCNRKHRVRNHCKTKPELTKDVTHASKGKLVHYKCDTELIKACEKGKLETVKSLLSQGNRNINCRGRLGETPVMIAVSRRKNKVFEYLLSQECDLSAIDKTNQNVLHHACEAGHPDIVKKLISERCDTESRDDHERTPVMLAALFGHKEVFQILYREGCNLTVVDIHNNTILHLACYSGLGSVSMLKYILSLNKFDIDVKGHGGMTPVMKATEYSKKKMVIFLVERGCNVKAVDDERNNILHVAAAVSKNLNVVKYLISLEDCKGLEKQENIHGETPIQVAVKHGLKDVIRFLEGRK